MGLAALLGIRKSIQVVAKLKDLDVYVVRPRKKTQGYIPIRHYELEDIKLSNQNGGDIVIDGEELRSGKWKIC